jgi:phospholipid/cholesterol/gamma-HCH transport system substrate-binding protein
VTSIAATRIAGMAAAILLAGLLYVGIDYALSPPGGSYEVTAVLGERAGQGVSAGTDVKARGVIVGEVAEVWLDERARPIATLTIFPDYELPPPDRIELAIGSKTFLGPKQIELHFEGPLGGSGLAPGDVLEVAEGRGAQEPVDMLDEFADVMEAIPGDRLAEIYEAFATYTPHDAEIAGRNIELSDQMFEFQARTADLQIQNLTNLADIVEEVAPRTEDINRLTATLPIWASLLPDRQADMRANFESLARFAEGFAVLLEVVEDDLSELIRLGNTVLLGIEPRVDQVGVLVDGLRRYSNQFLRHNATLTDGSEHGYIRVLLPVFEEMCDRFPEEFQEGMSEFLPGCPSPEGGPRHDDEDDDGDDEDDDDGGLPLGEGAP